MIPQIYDAAELSLAAYASLIPGATTSQRNALGTEGFSLSQAVEFATRFPAVVAQFGDATGFSATVFKDASNNLSLTIRGTQIEANDLKTDTDIALSGAAYDQIVAMVNWWQRVSAPEGQSDVRQFRLASYAPDSVPAGAVVLRPDADSVLVLEDAPNVLAAEGAENLSSALAADPDQKIDVTGHSLGGHLAMVFSSVFAALTGQVAVFNAPGFLDNATNQAFFAKLGGNVPASGAILNVIADEALVGNKPFNGIAGLWSRPGQHIDIAIENQWQSDEPDPAPSRNHAIGPLVDALAVYKLLADLSPTLTEAEYKVILNQAARGTAAGYERVVDSLEGLFRVNDDLLPTGNLQREELYQAIYGLRAPQSSSYDAKIGLLEIRPTSDDAATLRAGAEAPGLDGTAFRYALTALDPFVVLGAEAASLYAAQDANGELDVYDAATRTGELTTHWLEDRAAFLERKLYITRLDRDQYFQDPIRLATGESPNPEDLRGRTYQLEANDFQDRTSGFVATTGGNADSLRHFIFGGSTADVIIGAGRDDHLYGGAGNDVIAGGVDNDYLEGGAGFDTYRFNSDDGQDVVFDLDGSGIIVRSGGGAGIALRSSDTQWTLGGTTYTRNGADLQIAYSGSADTITVRDFDFAKAQATGYLALRLLDVPAAPQVTNSISGTGSIGDTAASDLIQGSPENDSIAADNGGNDWIRAGAGRDLITDSGGNDLVEGGADGDAAYLGSGNDVFYGDDQPADTNAYVVALLDSAAQGSGAKGDFGAGGSGNDLLLAGSGNDLLAGGEGSDVLISGAGSDFVLGDADYAAGLNWEVQNDPAGGPGKIFIGVTGEASPTLGAADVILTGAGDDWVGAGRGDDYIDTSSGDDTVLAEGGADVVFTGAGNDRVYGDFSAYTLAADNGADFIDLGPGDDFAWGDGGADMLFGGDGIDVLYGDNDDLPLADQADDLLDGGAGNDTLYGQGGEDTLIGGRGNDQLLGGTGKDTYVFNRGDGVEIVFDAPEKPDASDASIVRFGPEVARSQVKFRLGSLFIDVGADEGIHMADWERFNPDALPILDRLEFDNGDVITWQDFLAQGIDIDGTEEDDNGHDAAHPVLVGSAVKDNIRGLGGNDVLAGLQGNDVLDGGAGEDELQGGVGNDRLRGGSGNDVLFGQDGDDSLDGGAGSDFLLGGAGEDTYVFRAGDFAFDYDGGVAIAFGEGISDGDVSLQRQLINGSPVYSIGLQGTTLDSEKFFISLGDDEQLDAFLFADGSELDHDELLRATWVDQAHVVGSAGADTLEGYAGDDFLQGGDGDDALSGWRGNDRLEGGAGGDALDGGEGDDLLLGGAGADELTGGAGNDTLTGGDGSDLYVYRRGDGDDAIAEQGDAAAIDVLQFFDVGSADVALERRASGDLVATVAGGGSVTISNHYGAAGQKLEGIVFADGVSLNAAALDALAVPPITGTSGDDVLAGTPYADVLQGGAGVDSYRLSPNGGDDRVVEDGAEPSVIQLDAGWRFADLATARQNDDLVVSLKNGAASLMLPGYYQGASAWTVRTEAGEEQTLPQLIDYLAAIEPPHTAAEVREQYLDWARQRYQGYLAGFGATGDIDVRPQAFTDATPFYNQPPYGETGSAGNYHLIIQDIAANAGSNTLSLYYDVLADGGAGNDLVSNTGAAFVSNQMAPNDASIGSFLYGNDGNDTIFGTWSNDWILGGNGDDYLAGSQGHDRYVVLASDTGTKIVDEANPYVRIGGYGDNQAGRYSTDELVFADLAFADATLSAGQFDTTATSSSGHGQTLATLDISWGAGEVRLLLPQRTDPSVSQFPGESYGVETVRFADGTVLQLWDMLNGVPFFESGQPGDQWLVDGSEGSDTLFNFTGYRATMNGRGGDDSIFGGVLADAINGGEGNDYLAGDFGNDVLSGGPGRDYLAGGAGDDTFVYARGDGTDVISDSSGTLGVERNVVRFGAGIAPGDIVVTQDGYDLYLVVRGTGDYVQLGNAVGGGIAAWGLARVEFADGTQWAGDTLPGRSAPPPGTEFDDVIGGGEGNDVASGSGGNDYMVGLGGDDALYGDGGDDTLYGNAGHDLLLGGEGADDLEEWDAESNFIHAGAGDDYVYADAAPSFVIGGGGSDWIDVFGQASVVAYNAGDGEDTVYAYAPFTLSLGGIDAAALTLQADGTDFVLGAGAGDAVRFYRPWWDTTPMPAVRLQIVGDEGVSVYDLGALLADFNQPGAVSLGGILPAYLSRSSVAEAYGGDLAYDYAKGRLDENVAATAVLAVIRDPAFGVAAQALTHPEAPPVAGGSGSELVFGTAAGETLAGGAGDDLLLGGAGADTYVYNLGDGVDTIADLSSPSASNTVRFGPGITPDMLSLGLGSLLLRIGDAGAIHFESFDPANALGARDADRFVFADGAVLAYEQLLARGFDIHGTDGDDALGGTNLVDRMRGGRGADLLAGGPGSDRYYFESGDGADTIREGMDPASIDVLRLGAGIDAGDLRVTRSAEAIVVALNQSGDSITLADWFATPGGTIESIEFADGSSWAAADLEAHVSAGNQPPALALPIADQAATEDAPFAFTVPAGTFADPDAGDTLAWSASNLPAWLSFDGVQRVLSGTPGNADVGSSEIMVTVTDSRGEAASDSFTLAVANVNDAPVVAHALEPAAVEAGKPFRLTLAPDTFADEDAGDHLALAASLLDGSALPSWLAFDAASATFTGNPPRKLNGVPRIRVTATDEAGLSAASDFGLVVYAPAGAKVKGGAGDDLLFGGTGDETLKAKGGDDLIVGGRGDDTIRTGSGRDVIAFNRGDGFDTLVADRAGDNTLSLGGGIRYRDLSLEKSGKDLIVGTGAGEGIVLRDWYGGKRSLLTLQIVLDATEDFDAASSDPLRNRRVQTFDFAGLASAFDATRAQSPGLTSWALTNALLEHHLAASDDSAIGGDLAYWYGRNGWLGGSGIDAAQLAIGAADFGADAHSLRPFKGLREGLAKLT